MVSGRKSPPSSSRRQPTRTWRAMHKNVAERAPQLTYIATEGSTDSDLIGDLEICILILVRRAIRLRPDDPLETRQILRGNAAATPRMKNSKILWNYIRIVIKASLFFLEGLAYTNGPEVVF
ncbi:hypothetical protein EV126DRAFT_99415 [Verticillium dahliae]|nr:hypothetical protein EV126DRAFT_99415 [Verticillium dahliae]